MTNNSLKTVLLVEDNPGDARLLREMLKEESTLNTELTHVDCMSGAEEHLARHTADIVLLDLGLPDAQGLEAVRRARAAAPRVALVVLTGLDDEAQAVQALQEGAQDYLIKGQLSSRALLRALRYALERNTMDEALFAEKERAQVTLNCIGDAVACTNISGNITFLNLVAERLTGWSWKEAAGRPMAEVFRFVDTATSETIANPMEMAVGQNQTVHLRSNRILIRRDGFQIPIEDCVAPIHDRLGQATGAVTVFRDVSAARAMALQITREIEERRRNFETSLDLILVLDRDESFLRVSPASVPIVGYEPDEMIGRHAAEFINADDLASARREMDKARNGQAMRNFEYRYVHKKGCPVTLSWSGVWSEPEQKYFFIGRDVTEHIKLEQQLRQAQKMDAVGQLTGGIAHDFNNILTVIIGMSEILTNALKDNPKLGDIANMIDKAAERGAGLTQHLLAFARKQPLRPRVTEINGLIVSAAKLLRPALGEHIEIESMLEEKACRALVDPGQLTSALLNLAVNARDAMPDGGTLTIETDNVVLDESYCQMHSDVDPGSYVMIAVSDTGGGIPAAIRDKVFEPFFTTKAAGKGTGLGLSMVYGFVKQSAGHVEIYSEEEHGTTIKMYLPRSDSDVVDGFDSAPMDLQACGGGETVLVAEDDPMVRNYVTEQIKSLGYRTLFAEHGMEALSIIERGERVDLLFTDVIMPGGLNGRQLADEARKRCPDLKVLFTSGYAEDAIIHHGRLDPGVLLLAKPYRKSDLARMLRLALGTSESREKADALAS